MCQEKLWSSIFSDMKKMRLGTASLLYFSTFSNTSVLNERTTTGPHFDVVGGSLVNRDGPFGQPSGD
ncbi:hypothetical protein GALL_532270 [mine drainage metagenome]|uniref:Uncharacterized protein n=1 Tax=mine drainage metagenome TaxID=410659 RepID=A0A1J5P2D0_9ZZZZ